MMDLSECPDLPTDGVVAGSVLEELERSLLALKIVAHSIDLREAALAENVENLEPAVNDVSDGVVGCLRPDRRFDFGRVWFRKAIAVT
jgi:hypothetical protein